MRCRTRRLCVAGVAATFALGTVIACAKTPEPTLALGRDADGRLETLVYQCGDDRVSRVVAQDGATGREWAVERPVQAALGSGANGVLAFPLFDTPSGWLRTENRVSGIQPDRRYELHTVTTNGRRAALVFTSTEIEVGDGKVLAGEERNLSAVSREEFARRAAVTCD